MVSSTVPRFDEKWPPVCDTVWTTNSRSSVASAFSSRRDSRRTSAGVWIVSSSLVMVSRVAGDDAVGELAQLLGVGDGAAVERGVGGAAERFRVGVGGVEAEDGDVGRLVVLVVLAGGLAERRRRLRDVEDVVDDLEREAD